MTLSGNIAGAIIGFFFPVSLSYYLQFKKYLSGGYILSAN